MARIDQGQRGEDGVEEFGEGDIQAGCDVVGVRVVVGMVLIVFLVEYSCVCVLMMLIC